MIRSLFFWVVGFIGVLVLWTLGSFLTEPHQIPSPVAVYYSLIIDGSSHFQNGLQTATEALFGIVLASMIALCVTLCIALWPVSESAFYPFMVMLKASPAVAYVPLFVALFGMGTTPKIMVSALICFFPLMIGSIEGIKSVPNGLRTLANSYCITNRTKFFSLYWPYSFSGFITGMKTAAPLSVVGAIVGEYVVGGRPEGVGTFIISNLSYMTPVFAGMVVATAIGLLFFFTSLIIDYAFKNAFRIRA